MTVERGLDEVLAEIIKRGWAVTMHCDVAGDNIFAGVSSGSGTPNDQYLSSGNIRAATLQDALWQAFTKMADLSKVARK